MPDEPAGLAPEDFYYEGPYLVFTAAYHLKRGYCCGSGCRHCPYGDEKASPKSGCDDPAATAATMEQDRGN
ncbi:hypothetical protein GCM10022270_12620 [Terriglobus aquaticus]